MRPIDTQVDRNTYNVPTFETDPGSHWPWHKAIVDANGDDMVFKTSKWHRYLHREFAERSPVYAEIAEQGITEKELERWPGYMRELYARLYSDSPERLEEVDPTNSWAEKAHGLADELQEFKALQDRCRGDKLWSGMASTSMAEEVLKALPQPEQPIDDPKRLRQRVQGLESFAKAGIPVHNEIGDAKQAMQGAQANAQGYTDSIDSSAIRQAIRKAVEKANQDIEDAQNVFDSFGWGLDEGGDGRGGDIESKRELMKKVRDSKKLQQLAQLAGRMRRFAAQKQRTKAEHAREEVVGVVAGDDLARLLPSELIKLCDPRTKLEFYKNLIEKKLLCYDLSGKEKKSKGPIVVCVDNSGSMSGERELWSKAVALAMLDIARTQNRTFALLYFDTSVKLRLKWGRGMQDPDWDKVMEAMEYFSGGGTKFKPVLEEAIGIIGDEDKFTKADVILITDGQADTDYASHYKRKAEALGFTTYGILIHSGNEQSLAQYCDQVIKVQDLTGPNNATDTLFQI